MENNNEQIDGATKLTELDQSVQEETINFEDIVQRKHMLSPMPLKDKQKIQNHSSSAPSRTTSLSKEGMQKLFTSLTQNGQKTLFQHGFNKLCEPLTLDSDKILESNTIAPNTNPCPSEQEQKEYIKNMEVKKLYRGLV